jgi:Protein of unknown function (DUF3073)
MGRGRAKAKQVKVARQLKYSGGGMDLDQLRAEFGVGTEQQDADDHAAYADFANRYSVDDEDDEDDDEDDDYAVDDEDDDYGIDDLDDDLDLDEDDGLDQDDGLDDEDDLDEGLDDEDDSVQTSRRVGR